MKTVIFPGTFDPITAGHVNLVERAIKLFDKVILAIAINEKKQPLFDLQQRIDLCGQSLDHLHNIEVCGFSNLLVDFAKSKTSYVVLRGLRTTVDFERENQLADMNRLLSSELETVFLTPLPQLSFISSSLVREIAGKGGDVSSLVPNGVCVALKARFNHQST